MVEYELLHYMYKCTVTHIRMVYSWLINVTAVIEVMAEILYEDL